MDTTVSLVIGTKDLAARERPWTVEHWSTRGLLGSYLVRNVHGQYLDREFTDELEALREANRLNRAK